MLKHNNKNIFPLVVMGASLTLSACVGVFDNDDDGIPTDGASELQEQPDTGALQPEPESSIDGSSTDVDENTEDTVVTEEPESGATEEETSTANEETSTENQETVDEQQNTDTALNAGLSEAISEISEPTTGPERPADTDTDGSDDNSQNSSDTTDTDGAQQFTTEETSTQPTPSVISSDVVTPSENNPFSKFQLEDSLYTNNVYDGRQLDADNNWQLIYYDGVQDFVRWEVPAVAGGNSDPCSRPHAEESTSLSYRLTSRKDSPHERNTFVRSYPAMVVGSMGGRYESWGVECGQVDTILPSVQRHGGSPVFQMETVAEATGLPVVVGDLDYDIRVSIKADLYTDQASTGIANLFLDSYWHNVSDIDLVPGNEPELVDTVNGISSDYTEVWNLNIWFDYPRIEGNASSWTGGFNIGSVSLAEGGDFDIYFKIEGSRDGHLPRCRLGGPENCFLYIGLVATDANAAINGINVNYSEIAEWMQSADFRDLFLTGALETDTPAAKAFEAWQMIDGSDNDGHPDPAKRGPRFPDENHVIGGVHLGSELWYNPDAIPATIEFEALGVEVEGFGQFGNFIDYE